MSSVNMITTYSLSKRRTLGEHKKHKDRPMVMSTIDDKTTILIGSLLNAGLISFDATEGKISKKDKDGKWIVVREMSDEYSMEERKRLFSDFLNTDDGKALKTDLEKDLKAFEKAVKKTTE